jgi:hypothetical protein
MACAQHRGARNERACDVERRTRNTRHGFLLRFDMTSVCTADAVPMPHYGAVSGTRHAAKLDRSGKQSLRFASRLP